MQKEQTEFNPINLFSEQQIKLETLRSLHARHPEFIGWRNTTTTLFQKLLPDSPHFATFSDLRFRGQQQLGVRRLPYSYRGTPPRESTSPEDTAKFQSDCDIAVACIKGAIDEILAFGVHADTGTGKVPHARGGFQQNFNGPVTIQNQAVATDKAIQNIGQMGDTGASLQEITALLNQSLDLTGRERIEGLKAIEAIVAEMKKPEDVRNWNSVFQWGEKLVTVAGKATDMASKLAPHIPAISALIGHAAKKLFGR
jgi:hypothetical protein